MLLTLLSMLGGGFMRLLPELLGLWNKKTDNAHELALLDKQFELEQKRVAGRIEEAQVQGDYAEALALLDAQKEALKGQMQMTGMHVVDALNFLVRPVTTYFMLIMYLLAKVAMFIIAVRSGLDGWDAVLKLYDGEDRAILSGILAYWFVGRTLDRQNGTIK